MDGQKNLTLQETAKRLGMGRNKFIALLKDQKIIYKDKQTNINLPFSRFVDQGYLTTKNSSWKHDVLGEQISTKIMVTTDGLFWLDELIKKIKLGKAA